MSTVRRYEHIDAAQLKRPERMDNGFLRVEGRLARVGIQLYRDSAGKTLRELRLPEDVFDQKSLDSFQQVPVTNMHPPVLLTAANAKTYSVGSVGEDIRRDGDFMVARLMITDADAIASAEQGRSQLSNGYTCSLDATQDPALAEKWGPYDFIQRDIRGNHVALVDVARAGPEARLRLDGADAAAGNFGSELASPDLAVIASDHPHHSALNGSKPTMPIKFQVDGFEVEVQDSNAKSAIERALVAAKKDSADQLTAEKAAHAATQHKLDAALAERKVVADKFDELDAKSKIDADKMKPCKECDGSGKVDGEMCTACKGKGEVKMAAFGDDAFLDGMIERISSRRADARATLLETAHSILGARAKLDGKTAIEIKREVITALQPGVKLDGESDTFIEHAFKFALAAKNDRPMQRSAVADARTVVDPVRGSASNDQAQAHADTSEPGGARAAMLSRNQAALVKK